MTEDYIADPTLICDKTANNGVQDFVIVSVTYVVKDVFLMLI